MPRSGSPVHKSEADAKESFATTKSSYQKYKNRRKPIRKHHRGRRGEPFLVNRYNTKAKVEPSQLDATASLRVPRAAQRTGTDRRGRDSRAHCRLPVQDAEHIAVFRSSGTHCRLPDVQRHAVVRQHDAVSVTGCTRRKRDSPRLWPPPKWGPCAASAPLVAVGRRALRVNGDSECLAGSLS